MVTGVWKMTVVSWWFSSQVGKFQFNLKQEILNTMTIQITTDFRPDFSIRGVGQDSVFTRIEVL